MRSSLVYIYFETMERKSKKVSTMVQSALRVVAHRVCNASAFLLDGCYAFIALIILFVGLFYQGILTEHLSRNPLTNSGVKLVKIDGLTEPLFKQFFSTGAES